MILCDITFMILNIGIGVHKAKFYIGDVYMTENSNRRPSFIWAERANGPIWALIIAIGVPLMGWLVSSMEIKWIIAMFWFAIASPLYMFLEGREIRGQMQGRGAIESGQATS